MPLGLREIEWVICTKFGLTRKQLRAERIIGGKAVYRPRQIGMFLAREMTTASYPQIARWFGRRDHSTIISSVRRIKELIETNPKVAKHVEECRAAVPIRAHSVSAMSTHN